MSQESASLVILIGEFDSKKTMFRTEFDKEQKLWRGAYDPALFIPGLSVGRIIQYALRLHGKRVAQVNRIASSFIIIILSPKRITPKSSEMLFFVLDQ